VIRRAALSQYAGAVAKHLWTTGADLTISELVRDRPSGSRARLMIQGELPGGGGPKHAVVGITEDWVLRGQWWELAEYLYELVDRERARRRAFHCHDRDHFVERYRVVVHEHCEEVIRSSECEHYAGRPMANGHQAVEALLAEWVRDGPLGCAELVCLDPMPAVARPSSS
jgi:hypothetical protein